MLMEKHFLWAYQCSYRLLRFLYDQHQSQDVSVHVLFRPLYIYINIE